MSSTHAPLLENNSRPLNILFATEYLPPFVSGIANRCKNLVNGYREQGHNVTVFSIVGSDCDVVVPSVPNPFYKHQRTFILPPLSLIWELLDFTTPIKYDIAHLVAPLCLSFIPLLPLMWLRGIKIYVSYHVYLEYYRDHYVGTSDNIFIYLFNTICDLIFPLLYFIPLTWLASVVGIPSKTADNYVFDYSHRVHILKSGLDTNVFHPDAAFSHNPLKKNPSKVKLIETEIGETDNVYTNLRELSGPGNEKGPVLLYCGRLALEKNIEFLVNCMSQPLLQDATLVLVGDGPSRTSLEALAKSVVGSDYVYSFDPSMEDPLDGSKRHRVIFTGMVLNEHKVASLYAQADIFVSASGSETFGFTVAEAMACGTPSVVVRSGAFPTVYKMINDWMFDMDDSEGFADACSRVFNTIEESKLFARNVAVEGFSINSSVKDLLTTYYWIVNGCPDDL
ncbi:hypothetical protein BC833DRAFT_617495 [Globomyces pollinis-pini]|nr:hypothetical protein BC833DRAFT_617495 [Globomyces pollinis-pini]KAJ2999561.1 hypothetical protein HDV02_002526 [Globomyces sp. JEL0801]